MTTILFNITLAAYFGATLLCLGFVITPREAFFAWGRRLMAGGLALHTLALVLESSHKGYLPVGTVGGALALSSWTLSAMFLVFTLRHPVKVLGALAAPLVALLLSGALILPHPAPISPLLQNIWLSIHIIAALLGNATFTLAFLAGLLYLVQEKQLKARKFGFWYRRLPSLEALDSLNYYCLSIGFPLMTLGIVTGSLYAQQTLGAFWRWDPKETMTLIAWLLYAALLHERLVKGWRGRRAALMAIGGFLLLVVTFVGANVGLETYHSFGSSARQP